MFSIDILSEDFKNSGIILLQIPLQKLALGRLTNKPCTLPIALLHL